MRHHSNLTLFVFAQTYRSVRKLTIIMMHHSNLTLFVFAQTYRSVGKLRIIMMHVTALTQDEEVKSGVRVN